MHRFFQTEWAAPDTSGNHRDGAAGQRCIAEPCEAAHSRSLPAASPLDSGRMGHRPEPAPGSSDRGILNPGARTPEGLSASRASEWRTGLARVMKTTALATIRFHQVCISPTLPSSCRFYPTCSAYAYEAVEKWGVWKGSKMALQRLLRCRPFATHGYDPVP